VLVSLLYARFAWLEYLPDGSITANTTKFARAMGMRTYRLHEALAELKDLGFLDRLVWHQGWFLARPVNPRHHARILGGEHSTPGPIIRTSEGVQRVLEYAQAVIDVEAEMAGEAGE
jgi:hypothetical protein